MKSAARDAEHARQYFLRSQIDVPYKIGIGFKRTYNKILLSGKNPSDLSKK